MSVRRVHADEAQRFFEYLYVESNTGDSSGGHAAICFAERCYHFQQDEGQTIRLHRDDAAELDYRYRLLGNRTIHAIRIAVAPVAYDRLRSAFQERLQIQDRQYEVLESLTHDRQLLERIRDRAAGLQLETNAAAIRVPGSAYFVADDGNAQHMWADVGPSATLERLASDLRATYGSDFAERRAMALRAAIAHLRPASEVGTLPEAGKFPLASAGFATRHRELLSGWLALEVLRVAPALRTGSFHAPQGPDFVLQPAEIDGLRAAAAQLADALVRLVVSDRPDWGYPMLVGMARLLALEASIASGHLVLVDDFPEGARSIAAAIVSRHVETLRQVRDERRADFLEARRAFFAAPSREETALSRLETTGNLLIDIDQALHEHAVLRVSGGPVVPTRAATRSDWPLPELADSTLRRELVAAYDREDNYRAALADLYHYNLVARNCVTEIFRIVEPALSGDVPHIGGRHAARTNVLGALTFIPFLSAEAVGRAYHVAGSVERPSYRRMALDRMYHRENALRVDLRESNVLTAHSYERHGDDPIFLFFTDDVVLRRPLYGIANLVVGIGGTLAGLAMLPVDHGATLRAGLDGALFSLPEITFVNIRKGSFPFAPRRWLTEGARRQEEVSSDQ